MKVAIFTDTFLEVNGITTYIKSTIKELQKQGHQVIVFAPGKKTHMEFFEGARVYMFKSSPLPFYPGYLSVNLNEMFLKSYVLLEMENPDVYHIQDPFGAGLVGMYYAKWFKKPLINTYHTFYEEYAGHISKGKYKKLMKYLFGKTSWLILTGFSNRCDVTIAPTPQIAKVLEDHNINNVVIIPNGVDFSRVRSKALLNVRKEYDIPKNAKVILHLGRISFEKRIEILLKAFKEIENPQTYLIIVGSGPQLEYYKNFAKKLNINNVIFTGYVDDKYLSSYFAAADLFATASDTETFGLVILEAFAAGKPVVGPNYLGASDLIIDNYNGFLFEKGNYEDLAKKLNLILSNDKLRKKLSKNAKKFSEKYEISKTTEQLIELYKNTKYKPFKLKDILSFWPIKLKNSKISNLKKYLKRLKF